MKLAIFGFPVRHSLSPKMQTAALRAVGLDWTYEAIEVATLSLDALRGADWRGANVTIPHKEAAWKQCDQRAGDSEAIGAVNTVVVEKNRLIGHNTDAPGFLDAAGEVRDAMCAILGEGGSSRAVAFALKSAGAAEVRVIARKRGNWTAEAIASCDLVVGCVPPDAEPPPLDRLAANARIIDLVYYEESALASAARVRGLRYQDGLEVLVRQGARSFELWTGKTAPLEVMREAVRHAKDRQLESS